TLFRSHRAGAVGRGPGAGMDRRVHAPGRCRDRRLPGHEEPAGRGDVRLPVRRPAAGHPRAAGPAAGPGGTRMKAVAKHDAAGAGAAPAAEAITLTGAIPPGLAWGRRAAASVVVRGAAVGVNGGVFRPTAGLQQQSGPLRVLDTPLDETTIAGLTVGMAAMGMKPVAEAQFDGFIYPMLDH